MTDRFIRAVRVHACDQVDTAYLAGMRDMMKIAAAFGLYKIDPDDVLPARPEEVDKLPILCYSSIVFEDSFGNHLVGRYSYLPASAYFYTGKEEDCGLSPQPSSFLFASACEF